MFSALGKLDACLLIIVCCTEAFGTTWSKHYCQFTKDNRIFTMIPYTQTAGKIVIGLYVCLESLASCKRMKNLKATINYFFYRQ